ncbi:MAG: class I SAM-dependent methyltransferase [bacterium]
MSPNDPTAQFYDLKDEVALEITDAEVALINTIVESPAKILDIGCGTGRHLIPLNKSRHHLFGLDNSREHLKILRAKYPQAKFQQTNFWDFQTKEKFDLIILMWNAFNEIVLEDQELIEFFKKCQQFLQPRGKILINFMNFPKLDLSHWHAESGRELDGIKYKFSWQVQDFDPETNTTISKETISWLEVEISTEIKQRWWQLAEIERVATDFGFNSEAKSLSVNDDIYLILQGRIAIRQCYR